MEKKMVTHFSTSLDREMNMMIYGHAGTPILAFPTQDAMCRQFEGFGLIEQISDFLDEGKIQLFVVDTVDKESWSFKFGDPWQRADIQEEYFEYITQEVVPEIKTYNKGLPYTFGMSMGANHAAITFLRRPDLFAGTLSLSGVYEAAYFFGAFMNPTLYDNSPERFLPNMPLDHEYIPLYNSKKIIFCVGQGAWEDDGVRTLRNLENICKQKGIHAWFDYWGFDVYHDWPWWFKQIRYFLPYMLGDEPYEPNV